MIPHLGVDTCSGRLQLKLLCLYRQDLLSSWRHSTVRPFMPQLRLSCFLRNLRPFCHCPWTSPCLIQSLRCIFCARDIRQNRRQTCPTLDKLATVTTCYANCNENMALPWRVANTRVTLISRQLGTSRWGPSFMEKGWVCLTSGFRKKHLPKWCNLSTNLWLETTPKTSYFSRKNFLTSTPESPSSAIRLIISTAKVFLTDCGSIMAPEKPLSPCLT